MYAIRSYYGDNSFEKIIPITKDFEILGQYNATAFVLNITEAKIQPFYVTENIEQKESSTSIIRDEFFEINPVVNEKTSEQTFTYDETITNSEFTSYNFV